MARPRKTAAAEPAEPLPPVPPIDADDAAGDGKPPEKERASRARKPSGAQQRKTAARRRSGELETLRADLDAQLTRIGLVLAMPAPTAGYVVAERAPKTSDAILRLAETNPRILAALQTASQTAAIGEIAETIVAAALALRIDLAGAPPDGLVVNALGIDKAFEASHDGESAKHVAAERRAARQHAQAEAEAAAAAAAAAAAPAPAA